MAGVGVRGFGGDGGSAAAARFGLLGGIEAGPDRGLLVVDTGNERLRLVNLGDAPVSFAGITVDSGGVDSVAGGSFFPPGSPARDLELADASAVAIDGAGLVLLSRGTEVVVVNPGTESARAYGRTVLAGRTALVYDAARRGGLPLQDPRAVHLLHQARRDMILTDRTTIRVLNQDGTAHEYSGVVVEPGRSAVIAGGAVEGFSGDGGPALSASFSRPSGLANPPAATLVEPVRLLFVADTGNDRVRAIHLGNPGTDSAVDALGTSVSPGTVETVVGGAAGPLAADGDGLAPREASLLAPEGVVVARISGQDVLFVADTGHHRIRAVNPTGNSAVVLGGVTVDPGTIRTVVGTGAAGFSTDGPGPWSIDTPTALAWSRGVLCFGEAGTARIRAWNSGTETQTLGRIPIAPGEIRTLVGTGVRGTSGEGDLGPLVEIDTPRGLHLQTRGGFPQALYFTDHAQHLLRIMNLRNDDTDLNIALDGEGAATGQVAPGAVVTLAGVAAQPGTGGDGEEAAVMRFHGPWGIAWTSLEIFPASFYVADEGNGRLRCFGAPPTRPNTGP